jgi:hypothetical protein
VLIDAEEDPHQGYFKVYDDSGRKPRRVREFD